MSVRSKILKPFDEECVERVTSSLKKQNVKILEPCELLKIIKKENGLEVEMKIKEEIIIETFDTVIAAIGRTPSISKLNLDKIGIKIENEHIVVSDSFQTNISNIYSLGDAIGLMDLTPVAIRQGKIIAEILVKSKNRKLDYDNIPTTIFSPMEYGTCGLTEKKAIEKYTKENINIYKKSFNVLEFQLGFQFTNRQQAFVKLICLKTEDERVIGFHLVGPNAGEIASVFSMAMAKKITKDEMDDCVGVHPTLAEVLTQLEFGVTQDTGCCGLN